MTDLLLVQVIQRLIISSSEISEICDLMVDMLALFIRLAPNDKINSGDEDDQIIIWNMNNGQRLKVIDGHLKCIWSIVKLFKKQYN